MNDKIIISDNSSSNRAGYALLILLVINIFVKLVVLSGSTNNDGNGMLFVPLAPIFWAINIAVWVYFVFLALKFGKKTKVNLLEKIFLLLMIIYIILTFLAYS